MTVLYVMRTHAISVITKQELLPVLYHSLNDIIKQSS